MVNPNLKALAAARVKSKTYGAKAAPNAQFSTGMEVNYPQAKQMPVMKNVNPKDVLTMDSRIKNMKADPTQTANYFGSGKRYGSDSLLPTKVDKMKRMAR